MNEGRLRSSNGSTPCLSSGLSSLNLSRRRNYLSSPSRRDGAARRVNLACSKDDDNYYYHRGLHPLAHLHNAWQKIAHSLLPISHFPIFHPPPIPVRRMPLNNSFIPAGSACVESRSLISSPSSPTIITCFFPLPLHSSRFVSSTTHHTTITY